MGRFENKSIIVTGAGSGMGQLTAIRFVEEGGSVLGVDVNADGLSATAERCTGPGTFTSSITDISQRDACAAAVAQSIESNGKLDVLVNVAGVLRMNHTVNISPEELNLVMGVNLYGTIWMCQAALPHILESSGNIVNIASNAGLMGQAYCAAYCASKAAVINFTKSLAMEFIKSPIRVNCVAPGGTQTPMATATVFPDAVDFKLVEPYMGFRPLADPIGVADAILFVASDEAAAVHGSIFSVDSGITAG